MNTKMFKTIRFKLTFWYSVLLILLSLIFVVSINIVITKHFHAEPIVPGFILGPKARTVIERRWRDLDEERRDLVQEYRLEDLRKIREISVLSFIPLTILSFAGGYIIAGQMLKPIQKLNTATRKISAKNLSKQIEHEDTGDEISELIDNFNKMTARLDISFTAQKEFVENASHELKTPLAIVKTNLESALTDPKFSQHKASSLIKTSLKSTDFMNKLIEDLLLLALLENQIHKTPASISDVAQKSVEYLEPLAGKQRIKLDLKVSPSAQKVEIQANSELLQRAFMNVIENAIKYSPKGEKVHIKVKTRGSNIYIEIQDHGIGIPGKEENKIFERFYRIDKSRSRKTGGAGLGLAITKKIINLHNGTIRLKTGKKSGTTFIISLPLPPRNSKR